MHHRRGRAGSSFGHVSFWVTCCCPREVHGPNPEVNLSLLTRPNTIAARSKLGFGTAGALRQVWPLESTLVSKHDCLVQLYRVYKEAPATPLSARSQ